MSHTNTGVLVQHQAALAEGRFLIQKCDGCGQHIYFPREVCPHCGSDAVQFVSPSGQGTVYAVTTVRRKPAEGGDYNVSLIDLDEGPRLMSRVDNLKPDGVKIGQRVTARVVVADDKGVVVFDAVGGAA
ncbi:OB-fold domain-containing protein [Limnohabitans sp.]|uniref:Zn-ribbon domain-containing OB-fold protein n=1 Tax=Limnohabitans sp. TaxID=1907725 RepID=UPI00286F4253|nr:OB-fold domain-containing protein [Limnohabitans sp.]